MTRAPSRSCRSIARAISRSWQYAEAMKCCFDEQEDHVRGLQLPVDGRVELVLGRDASPSPRPDELLPLVQGREVGLRLSRAA
ncbi:MAG: hypothetical protein U0871_01010 [Gemmataceae bacterium]